MTTITQEGVRKFHTRRLKALRDQRSRWDQVYEAIGDYILPWEVDFLRSRTNDPRTGFDLIHNAYATDCCERLAATMFQGITSPSRAWFRLLPPDPAMMKTWRIREWLFYAEDVVREIFLRSNFYNMLPVLYLHMAGFGTGAAILDEDFEDVLRATTLPIGSYSIAVNARQRVDTLYCEHDWSVGAVVEEFCTTDGVVNPTKLANLSEATRRAWDNRKYDENVQVARAIVPNPIYDPNNQRSKYKAWTSCWFEERNNDADEDRVLRMSGYDQFPGLVPRWAVSGGRAYGYGPGWKTLPDVKELQLLKELAAESLDRVVDPAEIWPAALRRQRDAVKAGEPVYVDVPSGQHVGPVHVPQVDLEKVLAYQQGTRQDIGRAFFTDLILMTQSLSADQDARTAREIAERHEEKMLQMGAVLERLQEDGLEPAVERALFLAAKHKLIPRPPDEILQAGRLRLEVVSIFHQAQKMLGLAPIERFSIFVGQLATIWPASADRFNADGAVQEYHQGIHAPPRLIHTDEEMEQLRAARAERERAQQAAEAAPALAQAAAAAKNLSQVEEGDSALTRMIQRVQPGGPSA